MHHAEWYKKHKELPPVDWFEKVYELPKEGDHDYDKRKEFLVFYMDVWLPKAAGYENYKPEIRYYRKSIDYVTVPGDKPGDKNKKVPHVSHDSEAFGLLIYKNCRQKWTHIIPKKLEDEDWEIPAYDKDDGETHKYHTTLWSDGRNGQIKGGGWAPEAYDELSTYITTLKAFRKHDKQANWLVHGRMLEILRNDKGIQDDCPSRKRKRKSLAAARVYNDVVELSDVEYSDSDNDDEEERDEGGDAGTENAVTRKWVFLVALFGDGRWLYLVPKLTL